MASKNCKTCAVYPVSNPASQAETPPMMNPVVLRNFFRYVDWDDLATFRGVCNLWYETSFREWLNKAPNIRIDYSNGGKHLSKFKTRRCRLPELLSATKNAKAEPYKWGGISKYTNFTLNSYHFLESWGTNESFWDNYGSHMTNLILQGCKFDSMATLRKIFECVVTPKLEKLTIYRCNFEAALKRTQELSSLSQPQGITFPLAENSCLRSLCIGLDEPDLTFPIGWSDIFQYIPNLQVLDILCGVAFEDILEGLETVYKSPNKRSTKKPIPQLEDLRIHVSNSNAAEILQKILVIVERKLCELHIEGFEKISSVLFPKLNNLTHLSFKSYPIASLSFLRKCTRLKQLRFWELNAHHHYDDQPLFLRAKNDNGWQDSDKRMFKLPYMEAFDCNYAVMYSNIDIMQLGAWFGENLTCLKMHLCNETFQQVCIEFRQLRTLFIYCNLVTEEGFLHYDFLPDRTGLQYQYDQIEKSPNILDLKELKHLTIEKCYHGLKKYQLIAFAITEMSCYKGFLKLPKLSNLYVSPSLVSRDAAVLLDKFFPHWSEEL